MVPIFLIISPKSNSENWHYSIDTFSRKISLSIFILISKTFFYLKFLVDEKSLKIDLTVSARLQTLEISWFNINPSNGVIIITDQEPAKLGNFTLIKSTEPFLHIDDEKYYYQSNETNVSNENIDHGSFKTDRWLINGPNNRSILYTFDIDQSSGWHTTNLRFNNDLLKTVSISTNCYGYWAIYLNENGERKIETCIRAYPLWMNEMKDKIGKFKIRDLFIVGSHDSGAYRENFDPTQNETLVTKYSITQVRFLCFVFCLNCAAIILDQYADS